MYRNDYVGIKLKLKKTSEELFRINQILQQWKKLSQDVPWDQRSAISFDACFDNVNEDMIINLLENYYLKLLLEFDSLDSKEDD